MILTEPPGLSLFIIVMPLQEEFYKFTFDAIISYFVKGMSGFSRSLANHLDSQLYHLMLST